jgi:hypothetical protein
MSARASLAVTIREWQRLDWPRTMLAIVAALASGRALALTEPQLIVAGALVTVFVSSQLSFTRERDVPLLYFAAPLFARDLAIVLAGAPACVCAAVAAAFAAGASSVSALEPSVWLGIVEAGAVCALVMQSARMRSGAAQTAYRSLAIAGGAVLLSINELAGPAAGAAAALAALWLALRGFRETLARFDPV